jgi:hypothetical protein
MMMNGNASMTNGYDFFVPFPPAANTVTITRISTPAQTYKSTARFREKDGNTTSNRDDA